MTKPKNYCRAKFRETGNALLMGLVKISPGEFNNYQHELNTTIATWQKDAKRKSSTDKDNRDINHKTGELRAWSNIDHYYRTCMYSILGSWDLAHFTLTFDQGIATRLPYIGHAIGQQMYFLNDVSIKFPAEFRRFRTSSEKDKLSLFSALEDIGVTYCFCFNDKESLLEAVESSNNKENVLINRDNDGDGFIGEEGRYYSIVEKPFDLKAIYNGYIFGYDENTNDTSERESDPTPSNEFRNFQPWPRRKKAEIEKKLGLNQRKLKVQDDDALGVFQLNKNPNYKFENSRENRIIVYLFLLYKLAKSWQDLDSEEEITYLKPFLTDNFFDIAIIFRGKNYNLMKSIVHKSINITEDDVNTLHDLTSEGSLELFDKNYVVDNFVYATPLYHLSYNFEGFSFPQISGLQSIIEDTFTEHCKIAEEDPSSFGTCDDIDQYNKCVKASLCKAWNSEVRNFAQRSPQKRGSANANFDQVPQDNRVQPSILLSIQEDYKEQTACQLNMWSKKTQSVLDLSKCPEIKTVQGRYSFEVRFQEKIQLNQFIVAFAFLTIFLPKRCGRKVKYLRYQPVESRKMLNPLLQIKTKLHSTIEREESKDSMDGFRLETIKQEPYKGRFCLLNRVKMVQLCHDALEAMTKKQERPSFDYDDFYDKNSSLFNDLAVKNSYGTDADKYKDFREKFAKKLHKNLCYSLKSFLGIKPDNPYQSEFNKYLQKRLKGQVTPETLELLFSTLCAIDSYISNQISYYLFLDIRIFTIEFLTLLFSVEQGRDLDGRVHIVYWDHKNQKIEKCLYDKNETIKGLEYRVITFITTIEKISGQKISGSYPQHDRNFSRLSDIRVLQIKKIEAISWMINRLTKNFTSTYHVSLQQLSEDLKLSLKLNQEMFMAIPHHLPLFSNMPEMILDKASWTLGINVRNLASIEGLPLLTHEVGHIIAEFLLSQRKERFRDQLKPQFGVNPFDKVATSSKSTKLTRVAEGSNYDYDETTAGEDDKRPSSESFSGESYQLISSDFPCFWSEIFSDLYSCNISFAPLATYYAKDKFEHLCPRVKKDLPKRTIVYENLEESIITKYDQIDDFVLSFIAQIVRFPQIITNIGFYHLLIRVTTLLGIVKFHKNTSLLVHKDDSGSQSDHSHQSTNDIIRETDFLENTKKQEEVADTLWKDMIKPFFSSKLLRLLDKLRIRERESNAERVHTMDDDGVNNCLQTMILDDLLAGLKGEQENYASAFLSSDLKRIFIIFFKNYFEGIKVSDPFFLYLYKLASLEGVEKMTEKTPAKVSTVFKNTLDTYLVRQGIPPSDFSTLDATDSFCHSLQLCGTINLRFSVISNEEPIRIETTRESGRIQSTVQGARVV